MKKIIMLLTACCMLTLSLLLTPVQAAEQEKQDWQPEKITAAEMDKQLQTASAALYLKLNEDKVLVYQDTAKNRSLRKQLILNAPKDKILRLYTNDEKTFKQMSKMLRDYEQDNVDLGGYKVMTDVDLTKNLADGTTIYRFWFMKMQREKRDSRIPIGIGIGIGGGHHHPWIGIGL